MSGGLERVSLKCAVVGLKRFGDGVLDPALKGDVFV
jgi:hypothetical protein